MTSSVEGGGHDHAGLYPAAERSVSGGFGPLRIGSIVLLSLAAIVVSTIDFHAAPRFDETGYLILAEAVADGRGYREVDKPGAPVHAHFPPGWPVFLASFWIFVSDSTEMRTMVAHGVVAGLWILALVIWGKWFRRCFPVRVAWWLSVALAGNWLWIRLAGELRSESLFIVLSGLALLRMPSGGQSVGRSRAVSMGGILGAAMLTRHIGVALAAAMVTELAVCKRFRAMGVAVIVAAVVVSPWVVTQMLAGKGTQAELLVADTAGAGSLAGRIGSQGLFYVRRLPDSLFGPFVETATVFRGDRTIAAVATSVAGLFACVWLTGLVRMTRHERTRLAGLYLIGSMAILVVWPFTEAGRFLIPLVPLNLVAVTIGLESIVAGVAFRLPRFRFLVGRSVVAMALCSLSFGLYMGAKAWRRDSSASDERFEAACRWIGEHVPGDAVIAARHPGDVYWRTRRRAVTWPEAKTAAEAAAILRGAGAGYLFVDLGRYVGDEPPRWLDDSGPAGGVSGFRPIAGPASGMTIYEITAVEVESR